MLTSAVLLAPRLHIREYLGAQIDAHVSRILKYTSRDKAVALCTTAEMDHLGCWRRGDMGDAALLFFFLTPLAVALPPAGFRAAAAFFGKAFAFALAGL